MVEVMAVVAEAILAAMATLAIPKVAQAKS
jgi:hypothetical protein